MKEKLNKNILLCNVITVILMVCLVAAQFIPFWGVYLPNAETGELEMSTASLLGVTGRQYVHEDLIESLNVITEANGGFSHMDISTQVLLTICLGAFAIFLCVKNSHGWLRAVLTLVAAGAGASLWLLVPAYTLGLIGHILFGLSIALLIMGLILLIQFAREKLIDKHEREQG